MCGGGCGLGYGGYGYGLGLGLGYGGLYGGYGLGYGLGCGCGPWGYANLAVYSRRYYGGIGCCGFNRCGGYYNYHNYNGWY